MNELLLAFYGDDITGSTDALESLSCAGLKTVLFIEPPTETELTSYGELDAIGVAGITRSLPPDAMEEILRPAFQRLKDLAPKHVHYKVCSTFDSSPSVGSIGKAIDIGADVFRNRFIPILGGVPPLGRYCVFGNLFARMGIGSNGKIYRLDRHPSMSKHPVTPADESDLRVHLGKQTSKRIELLDFMHLRKSQEERIRQLDNLVVEGADVILVDAVTDEDLISIGEFLDTEAGLNSPLFSVGSSGVETALGKFRAEKNLTTGTTNWYYAQSSSPLLVLSGSCSPVTTQQIDWAISNGFKEIKIEITVVAEKNNRSLLKEYVRQALELLRDGRSVIIHTGNKTGDVIGGEVLGSALGKIGKAVLEQIRLQRVVIAGGDTSSFAAKALGIRALEMIAPLSPGAPLCSVNAPGSPADGIEICLKGGQVGREDFFGRAAGVEYPTSPPG